jgi:hypothetical protein
MKTSACWWAFFGFLAIAGYVLLAEHRAHVIQFLPIGLLALCPLMHMFHGHGQHGSHHQDPKDDSRR